MGWTTGKVERPAIFAGITGNGFDFPARRDSRLPCSLAVRLEPIHISLNHVRHVDIEFTDVDSSLNVSGSIYVGQSLVGHFTKHI